MVLYRAICAARSLKATSTSLALYVDSSSPTRKYRLTIQRYRAQTHLELTPAPAVLSGIDPESANTSQSKLPAQKQPLSSVITLTSTISNSLLLPLLPQISRTYPSTIISPITMTMVFSLLQLESNELAMNRIDFVEKWKDWPLRLEWRSRIFASNELRLLECY